MLVLEDDDQELEVAQEMFTDPPDPNDPILLEGESVIFAMSGNEAIEKISTMVPPIGFILDLNMPGQKNGFDVLLYIRQESRFPDAPIVIYSSSTNPGDKERCMAAGATDYVRKPDDIDEVEIELRRLLKLFRSWSIASSNDDDSLSELLRRAEG